MKQKYPKIALLAPITHNIPPVGYGPWELVVYNLAESLTQIGVSVTLFATKKTQTHAKLDAIIEKPLKEYAEAERQSFTEKHIEYALSKADTFDIIHNHLNIHPVLRAKNIKTPLVTTLHGSAIEKSNTAFYKDSGTTLFISISNAERKFMPQLNYLATVYNGVDFRKYPLRKSKGQYFFFSGRIVKEKGILSAIQIAKQTKIPLKIAGIITDQTFFDKKVKPSIDGTLISFLGDLPYPKLVQTLQGAIATLALIEWEEPFGLSVLDSLACGVPVVGTNRGALPELIYHKEMGVIVNDITEAIEKLDDIKKIDSKICRSLAEEKFSQETMAKEYLNAYMRMI